MLGLILTIILVFKTTQHEQHYALERLWCTAQRCHAQITRRIDIFADGFEGGGLETWNMKAPGACGH